MPKIITPARLPAASGVATGLAAAATSLAGIFTTGSGIGNAIVAAAGVLTTGASVFKFLEGQSAWETHIAPSGNASLAHAALAAQSVEEEPVQFEPDFNVGDATNAAELDDGEQPLADEPARLQAQLPATDASPPPAAEGPTVPLAGGSI